METFPKPLRVQLVLALSEPAGTRAEPARFWGARCSEATIFTVLALSEPAGTRAEPARFWGACCSETTIFQILSFSEPAGTRAGTRDFSRDVLYGMLTFVGRPATNIYY